tara:strand:- start:37554 stop:39749 length:2196 start_codon:yes stop_codon:yes gene_type:complete
MNFEKFKITSKNKSKETVETLCTDKKGQFSLQNHQLFLKSYVQSDLFEKNNRLMLYHGLGSGKTCSAISIANAFKMKHPRAQILVVTPASLIPNFYKEMKGMCGVTQFKELQNTKQTKKNNNPCVVENVNAVLKDIINVLSYQRFVKYHKNKTIQLKENTLIIIDEVQNIISETGTMYKYIATALSRTKASVVLLSGTPIFDKPNELAMLGNLLNTKRKLPIDIKQFMSVYGTTTSEDGTINVKNKDQLERFFGNKISYFRGSNPIAYPKKVEHEVYCPMSEFQYDGYMNSIGNIEKIVGKYGNMPTTFLISPRQSSNVLYPNGKLDIISAKKYDKQGYPSKKHAIKFYTCAQQINKSKGPVFVYSNFVSSCGINTFAAILKNEMKFEEVNMDMCPTKKGRHHRFAIFRTGQSEENTRILQIFNSPENKDGNLIKAILGSPAMKEGVTLLRTREVHLLDPYWNRSRIEQIMGRGVRFCSHKNLPVEDRHVDVYHYYAVSPQTPAGIYPHKSLTHRHPTKNTNMAVKTVDLHIRDMGIMKQRYNTVYEDILKEVAIDCSLFKHANEPPVIRCKTPNNKTNNNKNKLNVTDSNTTPNNKNYKKNISVINRTIKNTPSIKPVNKKLPKKALVFGTKRSSMFSKSLRKKGVKGCPKARRVLDDGTCPSVYPYKRMTKHGTTCCYKYMGASKTSNNVFTRTKCMSMKKEDLKQMAKSHGYSNGPITKKRLCDLVMA